MNNNNEIFYYPLAKNTISQEDLNALADWLKTNPRITMGGLTPDLERRCAKWTGRQYSVFVNSGSSANLLAAYIAKLKLEEKYRLVSSVGKPKVIVPAIRLVNNKFTIYYVWFRT